MPHFSIVSYLQSTNIGFKTELSSAEPETYTGASGFGQQIGVDGSVPDIKWIVVFNRSCSLKAWYKPFCLSSSENPLFRWGDTALIPS